jgi:hypothetical protein
MDPPVPSLLLPRTTGRLELRGAGDQGFRFGPSDSQSGSAATRPVSATNQEPWQSLSFPILALELGERDDALLAPADQFKALLCRHGGRGAVAAMAANAIVRHGAGPNTRLTGGDRAA